MTRILVVLCIVFIVIMAVLRRWQPTPPASPPAVEEQLSAPSVAVVPREWPVKRVEPPHVVEAPVLVAVPVRIDDPPVVTALDEDGIARMRAKTIQRELDLLENSPAKDSPEVKQIEGMLARYGIGKEGIPTAYGIAFNYAHTLAITSNSPIAKAMFDFETSGMMKFGVVDDKFWMELETIRPTVFFGERDYGPQERINIEQ